MMHDNKCPPPLTEKWLLLFRSIANIDCAMLDYK